MYRSVTGRAIKTLGVVKRIGESADYFSFFFSLVSEPKCWLTADSDKYFVLLFAQQAHVKIFVKRAAPYTYYAHIAI